MVKFAQGLANILKCRTPCKVANSTKMANLAEICHGFGEYMTIDEKKGDERFFQFTISSRLPRSKGPFCRLILRFDKPFAKFRQIHMFVVLLLWGISELWPCLSPWKDSTCRSIKRVKPLFPPNVAGENSRFPSRYATEDVSRGKTSATRRQKFDTDDAKSVQNPVRSADW